MHPTEWLRNFYAAKNIVTADGRELYKYQMSEKEFLELRMVLKTNPINQDSYQNWDTCFVLFGAEWWRRNYAGSQWGWDGILKDLDLHFEPNARGSLVAKGTARLKREVYRDRDGSNNYLGTIAIEAGIPTKSLQKDGWLAKIIRSSYKDFISLSSSSVSLLYTIQSHAERLHVPETFRKDIFYKLIDVVVRELLQLKKKYSLGEQSKPIEYLDSRDSSWRNVFPISVESLEGSNFLNQILTEISALKEIDKYPITAERRLIETSNGYSIKFELKLPSKSVTLEELRILEPRIVNNIGLASKLKIDLVGSSGYSKAIGFGWIAKKNDKTVIEFPNINHIELDQLIVEDKFELHLSYQGQTICHLRVCEALNTDVPWSFVKGCIYAQASSKTTEPEIIVLVRNDYIVENEVIEVLGRYKDWANLYRIVKRTVFINIYGERFFINVRANVNEIDRYSFIGKMLPSYINPDKSNVFLGIPRVIRIDPSTLESSPANGMQQVRSIRNGYTWSGADNNIQGDVEIRLVSTAGETLFQNKVFILPHNFEIKLIGDIRSPKTGKIQLRNLKPFQIQLHSREIDSVIENYDLDFELSLSSRLTSPPRVVILKILNSKYGDIEVKVPFPSAGAQIFDSSEMVVKRSSILNSSQLHGVRICLYNNANQSEKFTVKLRANGIGENEDLYFQEFKENLSDITEISLNGLKDEMDKLFAVIPQLDKTIILEVFDSSKVLKAAASIKQYTIDLDRIVIGNTLRLSSSTPFVNTILAKAFRFDIINQESEPISLTFDKINDYVSIEFEPHLGREGTWFIYPYDDAFFFRPFTILIGDEQKELTEIKLLKEVALIRDVKTRIDHLVIHLNRLSIEFDHVDWGEINWLWKQTQALPMASIDMWTAFSKNPKAVVALYCKLDSSALILDKLTSEYPMLIEAIGTDVWVEVMKGYFNFLIEKVGHEVASIIIGKKIETIEELYNLSNLRTILEFEILDIIDENNSSLPIDAFKYILKEKCDELIKRLNPDKCLPLLAGEINKGFQALPSWLQDSVPRIEYNNYKPIVYLPFLVAFRSIFIDPYPIDITPAQIYKIRKLKSFDEEWFYSSFDVIQGFCWNKRKTNDHKK